MRVLSEYWGNPKIKNRFLKIFSHVVKEWLKSSNIYFFRTKICKLKNTFFILTHNF